MTSTSADSAKDRLSSPTTALVCADKAPAAPATAPAMVYMASRRAKTGVPERRHARPVLVNAPHGQAERRVRPAGAAGRRRATSTASAYHAATLPSRSNAKRPNSGAMLKPDKPSSAPVQSRAFWARLSTICATATVSIRKVKP